MNLDKLLEYQKYDMEKIKLEKTLTDNINRQNVNKAVQIIKEAQNSTTKLDSDAKETIAQFENLLKSLDENVKTLENLQSINAKNQSNEKLQEYANATYNLATNFSILEKKILAIADKINSLLGNFNNAKNKINATKLKYDAEKAKYETFASTVKPEINNLNEKMTSLEKGIDPKLLEIYKTKRQDKIIPVFVPERSEACGGCMMALPSALLAKLKSQGYLECENCHRIIFKKD